MSEQRMTLKEANDYIKILDAIEPIFTFEQPVREDGFTTNESLAKAYADSGFRNHLKNKINKQIHNSSVNSETEKEMLINKGRIMVLKELYRDMERAYKTILSKKSQKATQ